MWTSQKGRQTDRHLQTSCCLQQRAQLCRDHQVCHVHHLPLGQLLKELLSLDSSAKWRWIKTGKEHLYGYVSYLILSKLPSYHLSPSPLLFSFPLGFKLHLQTDHRNHTLNIFTSIQSKKMLMHYWRKSGKNLQMYLHEWFIWAWRVASPRHERRYIVLWKQTSFTLMYRLRFTYMWTRERNRTRLSLIFT